MAPEDMTRRLDTEDRGTHLSGTPGGDQDVSYDPDLGGVARRMQDHARTDSDPQLDATGQLLEHIHRLGCEGECDSTLTALGCSVAFAWLVRTGAV